MKKVIIILIIVLILGGGVFWYFNRNVTKPDGTTTNSTFKSFFSFDNSSPDIKTNSNDKGGEVLPNETGAINKEQNANNTKLKQVTDFAVAGLATFMDTRPVTEAEKAPLLVEEGVGGGDPSSKTGGNDTGLVDPKSPPRPSNTPPQKGGEKIPKTPAKIIAPKIELPKVDIVPALRFVARSNGHVYEQYLDTLASGKISNTTIPTIQEAIFAKEGQFIIYRYLNNIDETIQSFLGTLGGETSGSFLPENIASITTAPSGSQFFYLVPIGNDIAGYIGSFTDSKKTQIFTSAFTEWIPQWAQPNTIFMTTKPSYLFKGSLYAINKLTGGFTKIFSGVNGLTTLAPPLGNLILYTNTDGGHPTLGLYNIINHSLSTLGLNTITDKCIWSQNGIDVYCAVPNEIQSAQYPDSWYKGLVSFNDSIVKINTLNSVSSTIINTEDIYALDAINLTLTPDEKTLYLINKKDSTLWSLNLE